MTRHFSIIDLAMRATAPLPTETRDSLRTACRQAEAAIAAVADSPLPAPWAFVEQVRNLAGSLLMLEQMGASGLDVSDIDPGQDVDGYEWARHEMAIDQTARAIVREARLLINERQGKGYRFTLKTAPKVAASPGDTVLVGYAPETCAADLDDLYRQIATLPPGSPYHIVVPAVALAKAVVIKPGEHAVLRLPASLSKAEEEAILESAAESRSGNVTLVPDDVGVEATRDPAVLILSTALRECAEVLGLMPGEVASKAVPRDVVTCREHAKLASDRATVVAKLKTWEPQWCNPVLKEPS